jgi:probable rRNA maturation factor
MHTSGLRKNQMKSGTLTAIRGDPMKQTNIKITFEGFFWKRPMIAGIIRQCIEKTLEHEKVAVPCEINVLVTDDQGIQAINLASRNIDKPTDVLSFPMFELEAGLPPEDWTAYLDAETGRCPLGDMCINLDRAALQAQEFGHSLRREVGYLTIHSVLHLLGYDHLDEGQMKAQMRAREEAIARRLEEMKAFEEAQRKIEEEKQRKLEAEEKLRREKEEED